MCTFSEAGSRGSLTEPAQIGEENLRRRRQNTIGFISDSVSVSLLWFRDHSNHSERRLASGLRMRRGDCILAGAVSFLVTAATLFAFFSLCNAPV